MMPGEGSDGEELRVTQARRLGAAILVGRSLRFRGNGLHGLTQLWL
jgi:hypothetical protein